MEIGDHRPVGYLLCLQPQRPSIAKRCQPRRALSSSGDALSGTLDGAAGGELPVVDPTLSADVFARDHVNMTVQ